MDYKLGVLLLAAIFHYGSNFDIVTTGDYFTHSPEESVSLHCVIEGDDFDAFSHVVKWKKLQREGDQVGVAVSSNAAMEGPFGVGGEANGRYKLSRTQQQTPIVQSDFMLQISNLEAADSGSYRCEVHTAEGVDDSVTHKLTIIDPSDTIEIRSDPDASAAQNISELAPIKDGGIIEFYKNQDGFFECLVEGGYPAPTLTVKIGTRMITAFLTLEKTVTLVGVVDGLQTYQTITRRYSTKFRVRDEDIGETLTCTAVVDDSIPIMSVSGQVLAKMAPVIVREGDECRTQYQTQEGATIFKISCRFRASPDPDSIEWSTSTTNENIDGLYDGKQLSDQYQTRMQLDGDSYIAQLEILEVQLKHFQEYDLTITNSLGTDNIKITLIEGNDPSRTTDHAQSIVFSSAVISLGVLASLHSKY